MAEHCIRIVLPGQPKAWQRAGQRVVTPKSGRPFIMHYTPAETAKEQEGLRFLGARAMAGKPPLEGAIDLRMIAYMAVPASWSKRKQADAIAGVIFPTTKPDADNLVKNIDAFKGICWRDDAQVVDVVCRKRYSDRPRLVIEIREMI